MRLLKLLGMTYRGARPTTVRLSVGVASLANSGRTGGVIAKIKAIVNCRQKDARAGMHLVVTVGLCVAVDEILSHFTHSALCSIGRVPRKLRPWLWR